MQLPRHGDSIIWSGCLSRYLTDPNSILAVVTPATVDPSTSLALREARKVCAHISRNAGEPQP